ncbi:MAG: serine/threonine protein kinase [Deltaproteobacteria bacterium]|nr:MAG: serine/threonine protein kinase [Deltaproteobacteria bacterium]
MNLEIDSDRMIGEVIASRYRIEARLGDGAMGTVYRARHIKVGRPFAVKVLRPSFLGSESIRRRFRREAQLAGTLHHDNIVGMVDVGETSGGMCYLVMEYAPGDTLYDLILRAAPIPSARFFSIVRQLCDGLAHAHDHGLIHRDFKPENVIVERDQLGADRLKIIDFGIAILHDEAASTGPERLTTAGLVLGTPHYMAPEQALGEPIDHRVDLFALGVMCFEMLTGKAPFDGSGVEIAFANVSLETPAMRDRAPDHAIDPLLEAFTRKLMMKSRDARPASAAATRALLDLIECDRPAAASVLGVALPDEPGAPVAARVARTGRLTRAPAPIDHSATDETTEQVVRVPPRHTTLAAATGAIAAIVVIAALAIALRARPTVPGAPPAPALVQPGDHAPPRAGPPAGPRATEPSAAVSAAPARIVTRAAVPHPVPRLSDRPAPPRDPHTPALPVSQPPASAPIAPPAAAAAPATQPAAVAAPAVPQTASAAPDAIPPAHVAELYGDVGRELKVLDQTHGSAATADLWVIYLRIRINDVITDPIKCAEADAVLRHLDAETVRRGKSPPE